MSPRRQASIIWWAPLSVPPCSAASLMAWYRPSWSTLYGSSLPPTPGSAVSTTALPLRSASHSPSSPRSATKNSWRSTRIWSVLKRGVLRGWIVRRRWLLRWFWTIGEGGWGGFCIVRPWEEWKPTGWVRTVSGYLWWLAGCFSWGRPSFWWSFSWCWDGSTRKW